MTISNALQGAGTLPVRILHEGNPLSATEKLKRDLLSYIASTRSAGDQVYSIRDFNSQVMSMTFDAAERDALPGALEELVATGILEQRSATDYALTPEGAAVILGVRQRR